MMKWIAALAVCFALGACGCSTQPPKPRQLVVTLDMPAVCSSAAESLALHKEQLKVAYYRNEVDKWKEYAKTLETRIGVGDNHEGKDEK